MREVISTILWIAIICGIAFLVVKYVGQRTRVEGSSMEPMLTNGDNLIIDKISYHFEDPERFDIIVFSYEYEDKTYFIKRIIGLPGETVRIDEQGFIYINGEKLEESYGLEVIQNPGIATQEITLGEDEYFVLGDNRNNSMDSRDDRVGTVNRDIIIGRAWIRFFPFDEMKMLLP